MGLRIPVVLPVLSVYANPFIMHVVFCTWNDYANLCKNLSDALRSVGVDSMAITLTPHRFDYRKQAFHVSSMQMREEMKRADLIIIGHTSETVLDLTRGLNKRIWVLHTGTPYRQNPDKANKIFDSVVERTLIDSPEFFTLGAKNITYVAAAIDTEAVRFTPSNNERLVFAHYPSKAETKGTTRIAEMMTDFDVEFVCDTAQVSHEENLERIGKCDVYIELFAPLQDGKPYGSFGVTCFEAAALGKIVVTNSLFHQVYNQAYGTSELQVANTERAFKCVIAELMGKPKWEIEVMQKQTRKWLVEKHSMQATGKYLKQFL